MASKQPQEQPPTLHSAIPGQGLYSIGDASGNRRWINAGREVNGWKVGDYDHKSNTLTVSKGNRKEYLQMGAGSVSDYTPPVATPNAQTFFGGGSLSDSDREIYSNGNVILNYIEAQDHNAEFQSQMGKLRKVMNAQFPTATPVPEPAASQGGLNTYLVKDAYGKIQRHYYNGDLPNDAIPGSEGK